MPDSTKSGTFLAYQAAPPRPRSAWIGWAAVAAGALLVLTAPWNRGSRTPGTGTTGIEAHARLALAAAAADAPAAPAGGETLEQGLTLTIAPANAVGAAGDAVTDSRSARLVSLYVPEGSAPSPFVPPGRFTATWEGNLNMRIRDSYTFMALGRGKLTVTINDQPALETSGDDLSKQPGTALKLKKGKNHLVARYESPEKGDASVRLFWVVKDDLVQFFEPVPPNLFTHDVSAGPVAAGLRLREGRQLLAELRCTKCHATPGTPGALGGPAAGGAAASAAAPAGHAALDRMPELTMDAPSLTDVGSRLNSNWLAAWVSDPRSFRPDAHMPRLFHDDKSPKDAKDAKDAKAVDPRAADVAAYLASLGVPAAAPPKAAPTAAGAGAPAGAGGRLFANLNCAACHAPPEAAPAPAATGDAAAADTSNGGNSASQEGGNAAVFPRVPLDWVAAKYHPEALKQYLLKPEAHYAWNPMPNFRLSDAEAAQLAAYLLKSTAGKSSAAAAPPRGDAANGKKLVESAGCLNCHAVGDAQSRLKAPALADIPKDGWDKGCMAKDDAARKGAPDYDLTDGQRAALAAFAATDRTSLKRDSAAEFAERQVASMHCTACHMRDGRESLLATVYSDESKALQDKYPNPPPAGGAEAFAPDQRAPLITWAGEKLRPQWMEKFIAGQIPYKPRTYLYARMPGFVARGALIADGLAEEHGCETVAPEYPKPDPEMAPVGQKLVGKTPNQAFACVQCHAVAEVPPFAPFEAPALNFKYVRERLRKDYYHRWIHNPLKLDPNTKMPAFERDDGKTSITTVYDGDARKQFEAVWQYLLNGPDVRPPAE